MSIDQDCIVTFVDMVDIRTLAENPTTEASSKMRQFHGLIETHATHNLPSHKHIYAWNDSAAFLAYPDGEGSVQTILREIDILKRHIDDLCPSYAISVKGQAFGDPNPISPAVFDGNSDFRQSKFVFLRMSSYAFSNCFIIEKALGSRLKKPWYVDSRLVSGIQTFQTFSKHDVTLLPRNKKRKVFAYDGYLW